MKKAAKQLPNKKNATRTPPRLHGKQQQKGAKGPPAQKKNAPIQPKSPAKRKKAHINPTEQPGAIGKKHKNSAARQKNHNHAALNPHKCCAHDLCVSVKFVCSRCIAENCQHACVASSTFCIQHKCRYCLGPQSGNSGYCRQHKCATETCNLPARPGMVLCRPCGQQMGQKMREQKQKCAHPGCTTPAQRSAVFYFPHLGGVFQWNTPGPKLLCSCCVPLWP